MKHIENLKLVVKFGGSMLGNYKETQHTLPRLCDVLKKLKTVKMLSTTLSALKKHNLHDNTINNNIINNLRSDSKSDSKHNPSNDQKIILVLSAFKTVTRKLLSLSQNLNLPPNQTDEILSYGERFTCNIVEKFLQNAGFACKSLDHLFTPHSQQKYHSQQTPHIQHTTQQRTTNEHQTQSTLITTDNNFSQASIVDINIDIIQKTLENHDIVIIPGFIGNTISGEITTLGFEGSDITAITLAQFLKNDKCVLFKDVGGCFSTNPHHVINAVLYKEMAYDEAMILANNTNVIHKKCIEIAQNNNIQIIILNEEMNTSTIIKNMPLNENFFFVTSSSDKKDKKDKKMIDNNTNHMTNSDATPSTTLSTTLDTNPDEPSYINFEIFAHFNVAKKIDITHIKNTIQQNTYQNTHQNHQINISQHIQCTQHTDQTQRMQHIQIQLDNNENSQQEMKKQEIHIKTLLHDYLSRL